MSAATDYTEETTDPPSVEKLTYRSVNRIIQESKPHQVLFFTQRQECIFLGSAYNVGELS